MAERGSGLAGGPARIVVAGPLVPFAAGMRADLTGQGFTRHAVAAHSQLLAHLSGWLAARELTPGDVNADVLQSFLTDRRAAGHGFLVSLRGMAPVLGYLRGLGVLPKPGLPTPIGPARVSRLMCGSDYPFDMGLAQPLNLPRSVGIDDAALEANARGFFALDEGDTNE
jgi:hypothetical protein